MSIQKNFIVKNGLEVNNNLIFADTNSGKVGIATTGVNYTLDVNGTIGSDNLIISGVSTVNDIVINGRITAGSSLGASGQYLVSTGVGVTWIDASKLRIVDTQIASAGVTTFSTSYAVGLLDVFINGVRLSDSEYTANDSTTVTLNDACFGGETIDFITYTAANINSDVVVNYAKKSGIATYSNTSGIATYSNTSGIATNVIGGISSVSQLQVSGVSTFTSGPILVGSGTSTGTTSQRLQVTGGAYVSGNIGLGTTNPNYSLDINGTTRITGFIESQNTSTNTNNVLTLDATKGTVFTHTTTGNIGIVSFTGISTNRASTQTFTVLVTQGAVGYNTTSATGIGTQLATIVTEGGVGYSTHIKVGSGTTITLTNREGALDVLNFIVSYNGVGIASTNFTIIGMASTDFKGVI